MQMELSESVEKLGLCGNITQELKAKKIFRIGQLCKMRKSELAKLGFIIEEIEQIEIKLQLQGLDIKR